MRFSVQVLVFICTLFVVNVESDKALCQEVVTKLVKAQLKEVTNCIVKLKLTKTQDRIDKMSCVLKCVLQNEGFISEDGTADPAATLGFIEKHLPEEQIEKATIVIMDCQEAAANLKADEENCKSYDVLIKCAMSAMNKFCFS